MNRKGESLCCVVVNGNKVPREPELAAYVTAAVPHTVGVLLNSNTRRGNVVLGDKYRTLFGRNYLMDTLCGLEFKLSMPSFYQVNRDQAERAVRQGAGIRRAYRGGDGAGPVLRHRHHLPCAWPRRAKRVIGAEIVPPGHPRTPRRTPLRNGIENAEFFCGDAAEMAATAGRGQGLRPDVITRGPAPERAGPGGASAPCCSHGAGAGWSMSPATRPPWPGM